MKFTKIRGIGDHTIYGYDISQYNFQSYLENIFEHSLTNIEDICQDLKDKRHEFGDDYDGPIDLSDLQTNLHDIFYKNIKEDLKFKRLYCKLIKDIYEYFYSDSEALVYQSFPSIRFQFKDSIAVPPHKDSDSLASHPIGEENFIVPVTKMVNSATIHIESTPEQGDFQPINLSFGEILKFNGNMCIHQNESNKEDYVRISFDFRIIRLCKYYPYVQEKITFTNPRDGRTPVSLTIGSYYQITFKDQDLDSMMVWYKQSGLLMQHRPTFDELEANKCYEYLTEDNFITEHKKTNELEAMICAYLGVKNCIMTTSCTSALIISLMALDLSEGTEVIVPNYTMIATVNAIKHVGLNPILVDVDKDGFSITLDEVKKHVSRRTGAVIHVSINNRYRDLDKISVFCKEQGFFLIEDAAQSMGCKFKGERYLGTFSDVACFSLSTPKIISSGQGGYMVTDDEDLAIRLRQIKNFGRKESGKDVFEIFGINQKYTDIQAVITIEQMKKLPLRTIRMNEIYMHYYKQLNTFVKMIPPIYDGWFPWFVDIYCPSTHFRTELMKYLKTHKIQTRETYVEISKTNVYETNKLFPNTNFVSTKGLYLPCYVTLKDSEIQYICDVIKSFVLSRQEIVTYRHLELSDYKQYLNVMDQFRSTHIHMSYESFAKIYNKIMDNGTIIVAEISNQIIGSVSVLIEHKFVNYSAKYAHIEDVFVCEQFRKNHTGENLVKRAVQYSKANNVFKISLNCNDELYKFYSLNGFEKRQINMSQLG